MLVLDLSPRATCKECRRRRPVGAFYLYAGVRWSTCRDCKRREKALWKAQHPDRVVEHRRRHRATWTPEQRAADVQRAKEQRQRDPLANRLAQKKWRDANPEKMQAARVAWALANPEKAKAIQVRAAKKNGRSLSARRRARIARGGGTHSPDDVARILSAQNFVCVYCPASLHDGYEVDHKHPISRGGSNNPDNLQCLCRPCNRRKWARTHEEHAATLLAERTTEVSPR